jgi:hypothetical protein
MEVAVHLGLALAALQRLESDGIDVTINKRMLVEPSLEIAWRELLHIRFHNIPRERLLEDVSRLYTLDRNGRIINGHDQSTLPTHEGRQRNSDDKPKGNPIPKSRSRRSRRGTPRTG